MISCESQKEEDKKEPTKPNVETTTDKNDTQQEEVSKDTTDKPEETSKPSNNNSSTIKNQKTNWIKKLDGIKANMEDVQKQMDYGTTYEMGVAATEMYNRWDKPLNEIYQELIKQMPADKAKALEAEEIKWIEYKEEEGKKALKQYEGGSFAPINATLTKANITRDRCYELVNKYMTD